MKVEDFEKLWNEADETDHAKVMARRRMVANLVRQTVVHSLEVDEVVDWLLDESVDIDRSTLDEMTVRANLNRRHPMESRNPSKTEIKKHIAEICDLANRHDKQK